jgi:hypothetical protein
MRRREYVIGAASLLTVGSGCTAKANEESMTGFEPREVKDVSVTGLESTAVSVEPKIVNSVVSESETAKVSFKIRWTGDRPQELTYGSGIPFDCPQRSTESSGLLLLLEELDATRQSGSNWVPSEEPIEEFEVQLPLAVSYLEPGQTAQQEWELWADPKSGMEQIPTGGHSFVESLRIGDEDPIEWTTKIEIVSRH